MDSELGQRIQARLLPSTDQNAGPLAQVGVDIRKDVDSIVVAGAPGAGAERVLPLVLARGRFDFNKIEEMVGQHGGEVTQYQGVRIAEAREPAVAVAFLDSWLVAVGSPTAIRAAIDTKAAGKGSVKDDTELMRLVERVGANSAWAVARFDALQQHVPMPAGLAGQLPAITWFAAGGQTDDGLSATVYAETKDEQAAQDLREVIRGLVAIVRLQAGQRQEYADLVNSVKLSGEGKAISIEFSVPADMLDKLGVFTPQAPAKSIVGAASDHRPRAVSPAERRRSAAI
jgi:hypothetical protein